MDMMASKGCAIRGLYTRKACEVKEVWAGGKYRNARPDPDGARPGPDGKSATKLKVVAKAKISAKPEVAI